MVSNTASFRDPKRTKKLKADGLKALERQLKADFKAHCEQVKYESKLRERILEPIGRLLDQPSTRKAMQELQELDRKSMKPSAALEVQGHTVTLAQQPMAIWTHPG